MSDYLNQYLEVPRGTVLRETRRAVLIQWEQSVTGSKKTAVWVPRSVLREVRKGPFPPQRFLPRWFLRKRGLGWLVGQSEI